MENDQMSVPYIAHESEVARLERIIKRLWIVLIMTIVFLVVTNGVWIWYESQFEDKVITVEATQTTEGGGNNYALGGDLYGAAESAGDSQDAQP